MIQQARQKVVKQDKQEVKKDCDDPDICARALYDYQAGQSARSVHKHRASSVVVIQYNGSGSRLVNLR